MYGQNMMKLLVLCCFVGASLQAASRAEEYHKNERKQIKRELHQQQKRVVKHKVEHKKIERRVTRVQVKQERKVRERNVKRYYAMPRFVKPIPKERRWGRVVRYKPDRARAFVFRGTRYYRHNGVFYRPHQGRYVIVRPPIGAIVPALPLGYALISLYGRDYYFYDHTYYVWSDAPQGYRIVDSPSESQSVSVQAPQYVDENENELNDPYALGTVFDTLPEGATERILNGVDYYWIAGHYLSKSRQNGHDIYIVVSPR